MLAVVACALPEPRALPYGQAPDHELSPVPLLTTEENECWGTGRVLISREAPSGSCNISFHGILLCAGRWFMVDSQCSLVLLMQGCKEPMTWGSRCVVDGPATTRSVAAPH